MKISDLTPEQVRELAALVPTTAGSLRQNVEQRRGASAQRAIAIERAASKLGLDIRRESLNPGCKQCEFAKQCRAAQRKVKK